MAATHIFGLDPGRTARVQIVEVGSGHSLSGRD
jgi:hypothetical protein